MGAGGCDTGIYRAEAKGTTKHPIIPMTAPTAKNYPAHMSKVPSFRNPIKG